ncbi:MAG: transcriptional regulator NrdR [Dermatophilaceae bacterium]
MHCPFCRHTDSRVMDSRATDDGSAIRRRRQCPECGRRFTTVETASLSVVKRSGATEPFSRAKVLVGVRKACQGRPVTEDDLAILAQRVEESIRSTGQAEVEADEVGLAVLEPLRELDEVAYLRFASVYQGFDSLEDFETAITLLRVERDAAGPGGVGSADVPDGASGDGPDDARPPGPGRASSALAERGARTATPP